MQTTIWLNIIVVVIVRIVWVLFGNADPKDIGVGEGNVRHWWAWYNGCKHGRYGQYEMTSQVDKQVIGRPEEQNDWSDERHPSDDCPQNDGQFWAAFTVPTAAPILHS